MDKKISAIKELNKAVDLIKKDGTSIIISVANEESEEASGMIYGRNDLVSAQIFTLLDDFTENMSLEVFNVFYLHLLECLLEWKHRIEVQEGVSSESERPSVYPNVMKRGMRFPIDRDEE